MTKQTRNPNLPILEQLEPRLLLNGDLPLLVGLPETVPYSIPARLLQDYVSSIVGPAGVSTGGGGLEVADPPFPVVGVTGRAPSAGAVTIGGLSHITEFDWWYGCGPTAGGMIASWWDEAIRLTTGDFDLTVFPGGPSTYPIGSNWQYGLYPYYSYEPFVAPDVPNGVVSGWGHTYSARWEPATRTWIEYGWQNHAPNSLSDFMVSERVPVTAPVPPGYSYIEGASSPDEVQWGMGNFMAWDDPRTAANESWNMTLGQTWNGGPSGELDFASYMAAIDAGRPVFLYWEDAMGIGHTTMGVGYYMDPNTGDIYAEVLTTWNQGVREWRWVDQSIPTNPPNYLDPNNTSVQYTAVGMTEMALANMPLTGLSGYFAICHPDVSTLTVSIGLGDPASPVWETNVWSPDPQYQGRSHLVLTDIDLSAAMSSLSQTEDWYLKVEDTYAGAELRSVMDFQIRYAGYRWFTPSPDTEFVTGDATYAYLRSEVVGEIGGALWEDLNGDGVQDAGEPALENWTVYVDADENGALDPGEQTATTNAQGVYALTDLPIETYNVRVDAPAGWRATTPLAGYYTGLLTGEVIDDADFGFALTAEINGTVWNDLDRDGALTGGEPGLPGWTVYLDLDEDGVREEGTAFAYESSDVPVTIADEDTVTSELSVTDFDGPLTDVNVTLDLAHARTSDLTVTLISPSGTRVVLFDAVGSGEDFTDTTLDDEALLSILDGSAPFTGSWRPEEPLATLDGESANGTWTLEVVDGAAGEVGELSSWSLTLLAGGEPVTQTDSDGYYVFSGLMPGTYTVAMEVEYAWTQSAPAGGTHSVELESDEQAVNVDFGAYLGDLPDLAETSDAGSTFSPTVVNPYEGWTAEWETTNAGTADAGQFTVDFYASVDDDLGTTEDNYLLGSVTVDGLSAGETTTVELNLPSFPSIPPADYYVGVSIDPANTIVEPDEDNNLALDYDTYPLRVPGIRGVKFNDLNADGIRDADEPGLADWTVYVDLNNNGVLDTGLWRTYNSTDVPVDIPDLSTVTSELTVSGFQDTLTDVNVTLNISHTFDPDLTVVLTSPSGTSVQLFSMAGLLGATYANFSNTTLDDEAGTWILLGSAPFAGSYQPDEALAAFDGEDPNGVWTLEITDDWQGNEGTLNSWSLTLASVEPSTQTNAEGQYWFTGLWPGTYIVSEILQGGWQQSVPGTGSHQVTFTSGSLVEDVDFGNYDPTLPDLYDDGDAYSRFSPTAVTSPGDSWDVWWDIRNGGTAPAGLFRVDFYASEDDVITTDDHYLGYEEVPGLAAGSYIDINLSLLSFPALAAGDYYVGVIIDPDNAVQELDEANNTGVDHDYYPLTVTNLPELHARDGRWRGFAATTVYPGEQWDAWWRIVNTGLVDAGAFRVSFYASSDGSNITVRDEFLGSVMVPGLAAGASYDVDLSLFQFPQIEPGDYYVGIIIDSDEDVAEVDETNNTDMVDETVLTVPLALSGIHGSVWHDLDGNGVNLVDEPGLPGWVVYLDENLNGQPDLGERFTLTDANGEYWFTGLEAGTYTVRQVDRDGWSQTGPAGGGHEVTLAAGELVEDVDFGDAQHSKIAGNVYWDTDGDGSMGTNEIGLTGWHLTLFRDANDNGRMDAAEAGTFMEFYASVNGAYTFSGLIPGKYIIELDLEDGWVRTSPANGRQVVTITGAELIGPVDFGSSTPIELQGHKFHDLEANGVKDGQDPGLAGWMIYIDTNGNAQYDAGEPQTYTDGVDGFYSFEDLAPGIYEIREEQQTGWMQSYPIQTAAIGYWVATVYADTDPLTPEVVGNLDFGNYQYGQIQGTKFHDLDADGVWKAGEEPGLAGWTINLLKDDNDNGQADAGETQLSTTTDVDGNYSFIDLEPGIYVISEQLQGGWVQSAPATTTYRFIIESGDVVTGINFGNFQYAQIQGSKFHDVNADGVWDVATEPALAGWTVYLDQNQNGQLDGGETSTVTDATGAYSFANLIPGPYFVAEVVNSGWVQSYPAGASHQLTLQSGDVVPAIDFGNYQLVEIHGTKWHDLDGDGAWVAGEPPLSGWTIFLDHNGNGQLDGSEPFTSTDADGEYSFTGLVPGDYTVAEVVPFGWGQSAPAGGSHAVSLLSGDVAAGLDFFNFQYGQITGTKWHDLNADGVMDPGEPPLEGWTIFLDQNGNGVQDLVGAFTLDSSDVPVDILDWQTVTSDLIVAGVGGSIVDVNVTLSIGHSYDSNLTVSLISPGGTTVVLFSGVGGSGQDFTDTILDDEASTPIASGAAPFTGSYLPEGQLSDFDGESANGTWVLEIYDNMLLQQGSLIDWSISFVTVGQSEPSATTDASGNYTFTDLAPGTHVVAELPQNGWVETYPSTETHEVTLASGQLIEDVDFGNVEAAEVRGLKWHDLDGDGVQNAGEPGLAGWTISIFRDLDGDGQYDANETRQTTTSGANGEYAFTGLLPGDYVLAELSQGGWVQTAPAAGKYELTLATGELVEGLDFGNAVPGEIHGVKWHDVNNNGLIDTGEALLQGWVIFLDADGNGVRGPTEPFTTTDANGAYAFLNVVPGEYNVAEVGQSGWIQTTPASGANQVALVSGEVLTGVDFGNLQSSAIRGTKWHDLDADGVRDAGEPGLQDWTITLYQDLNANQQLDGDETLITTTTDASGDYEFADLLPGSYVVGEELSAGWLRSAPVGQTYQVSIVSGTLVEDRDFGNYQYGRLAGAKWHDFDADGIQDAGEPGLQGWTIKAFLDTDGDGQLDAGETEFQATTDQDGAYAFDDLRPGRYVVFELLQADWAQTHPGAGQYEIDLTSSLVMDDLDFGNERIPTVGNMAIVTDEDAPVSDVLTADDYEGNDLTFSVVDEPSFGAVTVDPDGSFTYTPNANYNGVDFFTYRADDGTGPSEAATVTITVAPVNDQPVAEAPAQTPTVDEDSSVQITLGGSDVETEYDDFVFTITLAPGHGTLTEVSHGVYEYVPDADYNGTDEFRFTVTDTGDPAGGDLGWGYGDPETSDQTAVTVTVAPVNDAPTAANAEATTDENEAVDILLPGDDLETPDDDLVYAITVQPSHGAVTVSNGVATYVPETGYFGLDAFYFTVTDTGEPDGVDVMTSDPGQVRIVITRTVVVDSDHKAELYLAPGLPKVVTVSMRGPGQGVLYLSGFGDSEGRDISQFILTGTTSKTSVTIKTKGGDLVLGDVSIDGSLKKFYGKTVHLDGELTATGFVGKLKLAEVDADHTITFGPRPAGDTKSTVSLYLDRVVDTTVISQTPIKYIKADQWVDGDGTADRIEAPWLYKVYVKGDFQADLVLSGAGAGDYTLKYAKVYDDLEGVTWDVNGLMGKLKVYGSARDVTILADGGIKYIKADEWVDTDGVADTIEAPWLGKLYAKGDFQGDLALSGAGADGYTLKYAKVYGDLTDSFWDVGGEIGKIRVYGTVADSTIRSTGGIRGITLGAASGADFLAGVDPAVQRHADDAGDFDVLATIDSFKVRGPKNAAPRWFFEDSNVSAARLGSVYLRNAEVDNGGVPFGIWARADGSGDEIGYVKHYDEVTGERWKWTPDEQQGPEQDLVVDLL